MAVEPLSDSTRTAKRNLLIASVLAVTYRAFDVTIDKLPFAGIVVDFNKGLFAFLLTLLLCWFLLTFLVYYFIDVRNIEPPLHQARGNEKYWADTEDRIQRYMHIMKNGVDHAISGSNLHVVYTGVLGNLLRQLVRTPPSEHERLILETPTRTLYELHMRNQINSIVQPAVCAQEFQQADTAVTQALWGFRDFERSSSLIAKSQRAGLNSLYGFRNYVLDGVIPAALGVLAVLAMYQIVSLEWLKEIAPVQ